MNVERAVTCWKFIGFRSSDGLPVFSLFEVSSVVKILVSLSFLTPLTCWKFRSSGMSDGLPVFSLSEVSSVVKILVPLSELPSVLKAFSGFGDKILQSDFTCSADVHS